MPTDPHYFPNDGQYVPIPDSIYAQYYGDCPNPCRKYHVSSALDGAETVAGIVLPFLARREIFHKVVKSRSLLSRQTTGKQAGKFITIYMNPHVSHRNGVIDSLGGLLAQAHAAGTIAPCPTIPKSRPYAHLFIETPLDPAGFIYGGSIVDPTE
jgi:hypothetical protein